MILTVLKWWFVVSIPVALLFGRLCATGDRRDDIDVEAGLRRLESFANHPSNRSEP